MFRVAIVDDEPVIRFGIKASVDWAGENVGTTVDFRNGEEAWRQIEREPVDILITDIKMPVMDGLELTRRTLSKYPDTKVILVSSYNDFEYVRQGLKLGVTDYLLKPALEPEGLLELVRKCLRQIEEERCQASERLLVRTTMQSRDRKKSESAVKRAIGLGEEPFPPDAVPSWMVGGYAVCHVWINGFRETQEMFGNLHVGVLLEEMQDVFYDATVEGIAFHAGDRGLVLVLPAPAGQAPLDTIRVLREAWQVKLSVGAAAGVATGAGSHSIRQTYADSERAVQRRFFEGDGIFEPAATVSGSMEHGVMAQLQDHLRAAMLSRDTEQADAAIRAWIAGRAAGRTEPDAIRKEACEIVTILFTKEQDGSLLMEVFDELKKCETFEELADLLWTHIRSCRKSCAPGSYAAKGNKQLIDNAIEYMEEGYMGELTLQQAADHVHMSRNYFSLQFKRHTGENFIDYLIRLRIARAKRLIAEPGLKIYEVAERSGFHDVKYFSKLFKRMTGLSPVDYREQLQSE